MNKKSLIAIGAALFFGLVAILLVNRYITQKEKKLYEGMDFVEVVVVNKDVAANTKITKDLLQIRKIPKKYLHGKTVEKKHVESIIGETLKHPLDQGDPLLWTSFGEETEQAIFGNLAKKVTKGERALSIPVDHVSGVSGLIKPNDHVDILCTVRSEKTGEEATITLLQNLTILATGSAMEGQSVQERRGYSTITLLVTLKEAEMLIFAQGRGKMIAILRNPDDIETIKDIPTVTFADIMESEYRSKIQDDRDKIEIYRGTKKENQKRKRY